jgi:predicted nucleic acid-binding protein
MAGRRDRKDAVYWDTCIWLAWFAEETRKPGEIEGIQEDVEQFERGDILIATCPIILPEMLNLSNKLTGRQKDRLDKFFDRSDVIKIAPDIEVCRIAQRLRDYYFVQCQTDGLPTLDMGDALHLACAIRYKCLAFHTLDENDSRKPGRPKRGLLGLSGNVAGYALTIRKPQAIQARLKLVQPVQRIREDGDEPFKTARDTPT